MNPQMISFIEVQNAISSRWSNFGEKEIQETARTLVTLCQIPQGATEVTEEQYRLAVQLLDTVLSGAAQTLEDAYSIITQNIVEIPPQTTEHAIQALNQKASIIGGQTEQAIQEVDQTELADFKQAYRTLVRGAIVNAVLSSQTTEVSVVDVVTGKSESDGDGPGFFTRAALEVVGQQQTSPNKALPESPQ